MEPPAPRGTGKGEMLDTGAVESRESADSAPPPGTAAVIKWLGSVAGFGVYLVLLGGVIEWARFRAAGLPSYSLLSTMGPSRLVAAGLPILLVVPVVAAIQGMAYVLEPVVRTRYRFGNRLKSVVVWMARGLFFIYWLAIFFLVALSVLEVEWRLSNWVSRMLGTTLGARLLLLGIATVAIFLVAWWRARNHVAPIAPAVDGRAPAEGDGEGVGDRKAPNTSVVQWWADKREWAARVGPVRKLWRWTGDVASREQIAATATAVTIAAMIPMAVGMLWGYRSIAVAIVTAGILTVGGAYFSIRLVARYSGAFDQSVDALGATLSRERTLESESHFAVASTLMILVFAVFLVPLWVTVTLLCLCGLFVVGASGKVTFRRTVVVTSLAAGAIVVALNFSPPVTFDRATVSTPAGPLAMGYFGADSSDTWLLACQRSKHYWSDKSTLFVIENSRLPEYAISTGGYAFAPRTVPTVASFLLSFVGVKALALSHDYFRPSAPGVGTQAPQPPKDLCGPQGTTIPQVTARLASIPFP
jgi:hypothetical protein